MNKAKEQIGDIARKIWEAFLACLAILTTLGRKMDDLARQQVVLEKKSDAIIAALEIGEGDDQEAADLAEMLASLQTLARKTKALAEKY